MQPVRTMEIPVEAILLHKSTTIYSAYTYNYNAFLIWHTPGEEQLLHYSLTAACYIVVTMKENPCIRILLIQVLFQDTTKSLLKSARNDSQLNSLWNALAAENLNKEESLIEKLIVWWMRNVLGCLLTMDFFDLSFCAIVEMLISWWFMCYVDLIKLRFKNWFWNISLNLTNRFRIK